MFQVKVVSDAGVYGIAERHRPGYSSGPGQFSNRVPTEKRILVAAIDVAPTDRYAASMSLLLSLLLALRTSARSRAALQLEILALRTNCRCCSAPGRGGYASQRRTVGSGSCCRVSGPNGERRFGSSSLRPSLPGTDGASICGGLEEPAPHGTTDGAGERPLADSHDGRGRSALGRTAHSR